MYIKDEKFVREGEYIYRVGKVYRRCNDKKTGRLLSEELLKKNHAKVMYEIAEDKATDKSVEEIKKIINEHETAKA